MIILKKGKFNYILAPRNKAMLCLQRLEILRVRTDFPCWPGLLPQLIGNRTPDIYFLAEIREKEKRIFLGSETIIKQRGLHMIEWILIKQPPPRVSETKETHKPTFRGGCNVRTGQ